MSTISKTKKAYTFAVGRRKSASARVRLFKGTGENMINGKRFFRIWHNLQNHLS